MRRYLLDTHISIWAASEPHRLSPTVRAIIADPQNVRYLSIASAWAMSIKYRLGKLSLPDPPAAFIATQNEKLVVTMLPITLEQATDVAHLPLHHNDPFDRILVTQCLRENLILLSADAAFNNYTGVTRIG